jgi:hypothetical protein
MGNIIAECSSFWREFYSIDPIKLDEERNYVINKRWSEIEILLEQRGYDTLDDDIGIIIYVERWVTSLSNYFDDFVPTNNYTSLGVDHWINTGLIDRINNYANNNGLSIMYEIEENYYKIFI